MTLSIVSFLASIVIALGYDYLLRIIIIDMEIKKDIFRLSLYLIFFLTILFQIYILDLYLEGKREWYWYWSPFFGGYGVLIFLKLRRRRNLSVPISVNRKKEK